MTGAGERREWAEESEELYEEGGGGSQPQKGALTGGGEGVREGGGR